MKILALLKFFEQENETVIIKFCFRKIFAHVSRDG